MNYFYTYALHLRIKRCLFPESFVEDVVRSISWKPVTNLSIHHVHPAPLPPGGPGRLLPRCCRHECRPRHRVDESGGSVGE